MKPQEAMLLAIQEGKKGAGFVSPNPLVGCVILDRNFNLLSEGYHAKYGEAHAEVNAMRAVSDPSYLEGAHVFVTLEPCAHEGKTPSCAKALANHPIASVTYGLEDPNPLVSGKGVEILRAAGKTVTQFSGLKAELEELCEIFLVNMRLKRPFVALKVAASLDGKIARPDGTSQWITNEESRAYVQYLRGCYDAVAIGANTFLQDNPRLNPRDARFAEKRSRVVIFDPRGRTLNQLPSSQLLQVRKSEDVLLVTGPEVAKNSSVAQVHVSLKDGEFDNLELLSVLKSESIDSLFVEGGARTYASFYNSNVVDRLYLFTASRLMGEGLHWTSYFSNPKFDLLDLELQKFGTDSLITGRPITSTNN